MVIHTHRGIYCICVNDEGQLLTIKKGGGPYKHRLDLPGGTLEKGETEIETVYRECLEETGYSLSSAVRIGERVYELPWHYKDNRTSQHTAVYFFVQIDSTISNRSLADILDQDSIGVVWINPDEIQEIWASPLVMEARQYWKAKKLNSTMKKYEEWTVLDHPVHPF